VFGLVLIGEIVDLMRNSSGRQFDGPLPRVVCYVSVQLSSAQLGSAQFSPAQFISAQLSLMSCPLLCQVMSMLLSSPSGNKRFQQRSESIFHH
jgi:hypothetical protein